MQIGNLTVGTTPVLIPLSGYLTYGVRLLARNANAGNCYVADLSGGLAAITATGDQVNLIPKGDPASVNPYTIAPGVYTGASSLYLVADTAGQIVDYSAA